MIIHRMSTEAPTPPVKFYKVIALTFLFLTVVLLGVIIFISSVRATITVLTKQDNQSVTLSISVGGAGQRSIAGSVTSSNFSYTKEFFPTGNKQVEDNARGKATIYNRTGAAQTLVKTTRLLNEDGILFRMATAATIPARGQTEVSVVADQKGIQGNIGPSSFTIPGLSPDKQKLIFAESKAAMTGGSHTVGVLSSDDLDNAKTDFGSAAVAEFSKSLPPLASGMARAISLSEEDLKFDHVAGDEVGSFLVSGASNMRVVEYRTQDVESLINREISAKVVDGTERYLVLSNTPKVELVNVDLKNGLATLNAREEVAVTLDSNSVKLSPENFFGKSRDEISRYVMGIDHVANVDVKFSPSWALSAPNVADHISVIVKSVK
ncbi:MAG: hypothetical protein AAB467_01630 [Patescibacteria group bacterium]